MMIIKNAMNENFYYLYSTITKIPIVYLYKSYIDQILFFCQYCHLVLSDMLLRRDQASFHFSINTQILFIIYCLVYTFYQVNIRTEHDNIGSKRCFLTVMLIHILTSRRLTVYVNPNILSVF